MSIAALLAAVALAAPNPIQTENARGGAEPAAWLPPAVPPTRIEGWASELGVLPGDQVHLHVSTDDGDRYRVEIYRLGWYSGLGARLLDCLPNCGGDEAGRRLGPRTGQARADWPVTDTFSVPADAVSGYYYALVRLTAGGDETGARAYVPFVVRAAPGRHAQILVQVPVNTWQAYNPWGGKSLYPFNSTDGISAVKVLHLNDSKKDLGSRVDRHEHIGLGKIGVEGFKPFVRDKAFAKVPKILETPKEKDERGRNWDEVNVETLRSLMG